MENEYNELKIKCLLEQQIAEFLLMVNPAITYADATREINSDLNNLRAEYGTLTAYYQEAQKPFKGIPDIK